MSFVPVTFGGENVTPKNDGGLYQAHYGDGILWGCGMSLTGTPYTDLTISAGEMIIGGRVIYIDGATDIDLTAIANTTNYVQIKGVITLGNNPVFDTALVESATATFPALTQEDINDNGTTYEVELAIVQASAGTPTAIYSKMEYSSIVCRNSNKFVTMRMLNDGTFRIGEMSGGNSVTGISSNGTGNLIAFADGQNVVIRPNGITSTTGQVQFTTSGQQTGGHPIVEDTQSTSTSVTAGTWTSALCTVTLDVGQYLLTGTANIRGVGASTTNWAMINIGHNTSSNICRNSIPLCGTTSVYLGANASILFDNSTANYTMDLYVNAEAATTVSNATLRAVRLG